MRLSVFTNLDLHSNIAINHLLPELKKHDFNLFLSHKVGGAASPQKPLQFLTYLEKTFLTNYVFPNIEKQPTGGFLSFEQISNQFKAPIEFVTDVNDPALLQRIASFRPEFFIVIRFGKIFKGKILSIPKNGIINLHSAILPDYRGVLGTLRAMQHHDPQIGATLHFITDSTIDTGDVIDFVKVDANYEKSILWNLAHLYQPAASRLAQIIATLSRGGAVDHFPQTTGGAYFSFPDIEDFEELSKASIKVFTLNDYASIISHYYQIEKDRVLHSIHSDPLAEGIPNEL